MFENMTGAQDIVETNGTDFAFNTQTIIVENN